VSEASEKNLELSHSYTCVETFRERGPASARSENNPEARRGRRRKGERLFNGGEGGEHGSGRRTRQNIKSRSNLVRGFVRLLKRASKNSEKEKRELGKRRLNQRACRREKNYTSGLTSRPATSPGLTRRTIRRIAEAARRSRAREGGRGRRDRNSSVGKKPPL